MVFDRAVVNHSPFFSFRRKKCEDTHIQRETMPSSSQKEIDSQAKEKGLRKIGKVKDAHGIRGEIFVIVFSGEAPWLDRLKELTIHGVRQEGGGWLTLDLKSARLHKNGFIASSPQIQNRNEAEALKGCELYVPVEFLISKPGDSIFLSEIEGFKVLLADGTELGQIIGFSSNGVQDLLVVRDKKINDEREILIPLIPEFVSEIRFEKSEIVMILPPGLTED